MKKLLYDFQCVDFHKFEALVEPDIESTTCPTCGLRSTRLISTPTIKLNGWSMHFPTAADKWANQHEEAARIANKRYRDHNEP